MSYNVNAMNAYQQYGSSMAAGGGGTNMSGSRAKQGLGTKPSDAYKQYAETMTAGGGGQTMAGTGTSAYQKAQQMAGGDGGEKPNSPAQLYKNSANAFTNSGVNLKDQTWTPSGDPRLLYNENRFKPEEIVTDVKDYLRGTAIQDALLEAQGFEAPRSALYTGENRPLTEQELQQYKPLFDLMDDSIEVEELSRMDREDQEALLESIGVGNLGRMPRDTAFLGGDFDVATTSQEFIRDALKAKRIAELKNMSKAFPNDASIQKDIQDLLNKIQGEEDETAPVVSPTDIDTDDADGGAAPSDGKGLMTKPLTAEQRNAVSSMQVVTTDYTLSSDELIEQAKELFPNNPIAAAAFIATVNAEAAGGKDMTENGYSKSQAIKKFVNPYKNKDGKLGPKMTARKKAIQDSKSSDEIFEIVYGSGYTGNSNLGNTEPGDGLRYIGRGPIQLTGKHNYEKYGKLAGYDIVSNPELMSSNQQVSLAVTKAYLEDKGLEDVKTARDLYAVIGHSGGMGEANKRWRNAKKLHKKLFGFDLGTGSSLRPRSRPDTIMASN